MSDVRDGLNMYVRLVGAQLRAQMQYRVSFVLALIGSFLATIAEFLVVLVLFGRIPLLVGWSIGEVALLYGLSGVAFAVAEMFSAALDNFQVHIQRGTFDRVLVRPRGALLQVLTDDFALRRLGRVTQALLVLAIAVQTLAVVWTPDRILVLAAALVSGTAIYFCIFVLGGAFCFWTTEGKEVTHVATYGGDALASYPLDVYGPWVRHFATFVIPLAFVNYYPLLYILDRPDPMGLPTVVQVMSPLVAAAMVGVAWVGWSAGVRRYQSTGS